MKLTFVILIIMLFLLSCCCGLNVTPKIQMLDFVAL
jgi:hypothetical protein